MEHVNACAQSGKDHTTYCDTVPILIHHHDAQEHAEREKEKTVDVMLDGIADGDAEREKKDLSDCKERRAEYDVADGPSIVEGAEYEDELRDDVDNDTYRGPQYVYNPKADRVREIETCEAFERSNGYEE
jgi:hypothetical protein